ncbi:MAG: chalcone isomerase family protein [Candidatus Latescibacterota bacterium]|nr:MAG: chalcone isomerase family protein [Candidatus Latescibacterota bacterium]
MKWLIGSLCVFVLVTGVFPSTAAAQEFVEESSTKKQFPKSVSFQHGGKEYSLSVTGVAVRKKLIFKVYGIAHYMDQAEFEDKNAALEAALADGHAKQITMDFARGVSVDKIQNAFRDGFKKHASDEEMDVITTFADQFVGYFDKGVEKNDQYVLRWLPDGIVLTTVQDEEKEPIANVTFAKVLWRIWLDKGSIVDRKKLVAMAVKE